MAKMKEIRFDLVPEKHKSLAKMAKAEGSSIAVLVQRAINMLLEKSEKDGV